tara:strand:- start:823 stop:927 length:105 start_codon:yes stop_codon:yes gene_type:complete
LLNIGKMKRQTEWMEGCESVEDVANAATTTYVRR